MWHVRFYVDLAGQEKRQRKSVPIGPWTGKDKLTKPEAERKGAEVITSVGVNTAEHLERAMNISPVVTFGSALNGAGSITRQTALGGATSFLPASND